MTYWRRRFVTLVLGLSVLAAVAWAFSGSRSSPAAAPPASSARTLHGGGPSPAVTPAGHGAGLGAASTRNHSPAAHAKTAGTGGVLPCPAGAVVISLFPGQASYSRRQTPQFEVDVVSTASQSCTFDIGSRHVQLAIASGRLRIWSSGDCAQGDTSLVTELRRGVPTVVPIGWKGQRSLPGCPVPGAGGRGSYTAVASAGSLRSNAVVFRIG